MGRRGPSSRLQTCCNTLGIRCLTRDLGDGWGTQTFRSMNEEMGTRSADTLILNFKILSLQNCEKKMCFSSESVYSIFCHSRPYVLGHSPHHNLAQRRTWRCPCVMSRRQQNRLSIPSPHSAPLSMATVSQERSDAKASHSSPTKALKVGHGWATGDWGMFGAQTEWFGFFAFVFF